MAYGRRGQYISNSELDVKLFALIKSSGKSESKIVREAIEKYFETVDKLNKLSK